MRLFRREKDLKRGHGSSAAYRPEAALPASPGPLTPPLLAGAAGLAGITALAFSSMATT